MNTAQTIGQLSEKIALEHLKKQGLKHIASNFRCKLGEIDIIMRDKDNLVFVEVRCRNNETFGTALETVTQHKQNKLIKAAQYYLQANNLLNTENCRFDVLAITNLMYTPKIEWIKNAFMV